MFRGEKLDPEKLEKLKEAFGYLNTYLDGHRFAVGNSITIADHALVASVSTFVETGVDISGFPNISAWLERCKKEMPGYDEANVPGAKEFGSFAKQKLGF